MLANIAFDSISKEQFRAFVRNFITSQKTLLEVIFAMKHKLNIDDLDAQFAEIKPYVMKFNISTSDILKLSHVFCNCGLYTNSVLSNWVDNNVELFDTEIYFYYRFFKQFNDYIKCDVPTKSNSSDSYKLDSEEEEMRLLNTVIKNYDQLAFV